MPSHAINLNVFSNVASNDPRHCLAPETILSFLDCFGSGAPGAELIIRIFIDPKPHREYYDEWLNTIAQRLPGVRYETVRTNGLYDGYWRSVRMSEGDYAVQLEHDWMFIKRRIRHGLHDIIDDMRARRINYLRFNKRRNVQFGIDYFVEDDDTGRIPTCRISGRSNNPHIIDVAYYRSLLENLKTVGLEGDICRYAGGGHLYGCAGWPRTVQHLDGRRARMKDNLARYYYLTLARGRDRLRLSWPRAAR
jgi:hypothetical protein